jgi:hypothetical protein
LPKIETIRDLVYSQMEQTKSKTITSTVVAPAYMAKILNSHRSGAAEFLGQNPEDRLKNTQVSLRKQIENSNSFINPSKHFETPTLLKKLSKNPEAVVDVAKAHTIMSQAEIKAMEMKELVSGGITSPQELIQVSRNNTFSKIPRTIEKLMR